MEQIKALNALEPFLILSKSATSARAAADLITRATSASGTFVFTELLEKPQIQALSSSDEYSPFLTHLQIFSHGTYTDYTNMPNLPPLSDAQRLKLRQLSILTLSRDKTNMAYPKLMALLGLDTRRALEDTVISTIYAGLIMAQLDPARQMVEVSSVAPLRDVTPGAVPDMIKALQAWSARCDSTLASIEAQIAGIRTAAVRKSSEKRQWDATVKTAIDEESRGENDKGVPVKDKKPMVAMGHSRNLRGKRGSERLVESSAMDDYDEAMDLDEDDENAADGSKKRVSRRKL